MLTFRTINFSCYCFSSSLLFHRGNEGDYLQAPWSLPWCPRNAPVEIYNVLIGSLRALYQGGNALVPVPFQKPNIQACSLMYCIRIRMCPILINNDVITSIAHSVCFFASDFEPMAFTVNWQQHCINNTFNVQLLLSVKAMGGFKVRHESQWLGFTSYCK